MKLYISGPISGLAAGVYKRAFSDAADFLRSRSHIPIDPTMLEPRGCECTPSELYAHDWACYLRRDLIEMLTYADGIVLLKGWETSHGAKLELSVAVACGLKAFRLLGLPPHPTQGSLGYRLVEIT